MWDVGHHLEPHGFKGDTVGGTLGHTSCKMIPHLENAS